MQKDLIILKVYKKAFVDIDAKQKITIRGNLIYYVCC